MGICLRLMKNSKLSEPNQVMWIGIALVIALGFAACGGTAQEADERPAAVTASPTPIVLDHPEPPQLISPVVPTQSALPTATVSATSERNPTPSVSPILTETATAVPTATPIPTVEPVPAFTFEMQQGTVARYLVQEQLASLDLPNDAVGETTGVSGSIAFSEDGSVMWETSRIEVDLQSLKSDSGKRDNYLRGKSLESERFPMVVFVPTEVTGLAWPLPSEDALVFEMAGDMRVRDVTRPVTWNVEASFDGHQVSGKAVTRFTFGDFQMKVPSVFIVISVEDDIRLEIDFVASVLAANQ